MAKRFIKLYEQIISWEWFKHPNTLAVFIYLLLKANYKNSDLNGIIIQRGQVLTSLTKISTDVGITIQQARTALMHLISTGEITDQSTTHYRIITVVKYDQYQKATDKSTDKSTDNQQKINRQTASNSTDVSTPYIEYIENKEGVEVKERKESPSSRERGTAARFTPPTFEEVAAYCFERNNRIDPQHFINHYEATGWKGVVDWKAKIRVWEDRDKNMAPPPNYSPRPEPPAKRVIAQQYEQRDYSAPKNESFDDLYDRLDGLMEPIEEVQE